ncbi:HNH endonuclease [Bradyrhizobium sp. U87765 SZCCT0131]|uniref:HNH endonuclease n=1 Tax=unclassified Bradyrhizobium TaxID=2631580 RepID=UPI001BABFF05|nr:MULTISPECIES: HNH endonuclease [unclassified Bradyrhizobium]MBR1220597.1 HNH endonuclease [Bradyrhizobium sp. U87765 SZCCT0131]MBR1262949.1 HNH endonuclease [Bradyrhizobium sp. U87765 SZCCT0134]MBR1307169.1 HNH endonuclease [Bradyrhizobium sp. U87765 SZCCT0110]MBR1322944.1 HNH endonuclease [Bradyrhizobium sp. U87765 SZCCT0109]MBR1346123.1 HNH endonuclease [Bradyrhizobium sp. U87765 SZCCT0048]
MGFGVFIHRSDSIYEDSPAEQYQFPAQYLRRVEACVGDWIIYYEPRKIVETRGYFAIARVGQVIPDPGAEGMYLALIEPGSYLDFANPVPFNGPTGPVETGVLNDQGRISGRAQSAVRPISPADFRRIIELGFEDKAPLLPRLDHDASLPGFDEQQAPFLFDQERDRVSVTMSRIQRDRVFRRVVLRAYDERCVITGLKLINGGGRAEVAAAHIRPVEANGPDIVSNGIALSGTAHWMFDRGLISLSDDLEILVSRQTNNPDEIRSIINKSGQALPPRRGSDRPHPHFLRWHREHCFKQ